jgi:condensin complex subunit 1
LTSSWFAVCEESVHALYKIHSSPELLMESVIKGLYDTLSSSTYQTNEAMSCFLFILGQSAINTVVEIEKIAKSMKQHLLVTATTTPSSTAVGKTEAKEGDKKTGVSNKEKKKVEEEEGNVDDFEEQMDVAAALDADFENEIYHLTERQLVSPYLPLPEASLSSETADLTDSIMKVNRNINLLGEFLPLIKFIVANPTKEFSNNHLRNTTVLTLCRYMSISSVICEENLSLLFTLLAEGENEENLSLKTTILVALGDFAFRFPNVMEPWTNQLYLR